MDFNNLKSFQKLNLIQNANIPITEKALLFSLKSYEPHIFVSAEKLAIQARTSTRTINRHLNKLRQNNLIIEIIIPGRTTVRKINYAELVKIGIINNQNTPDTSVTPNVTPLTSVSAPPDTSVTPPLTSVSAEVPILSNNISAKAKTETNVSSGNGGQRGIDKGSPLAESFGWNTNCAGFSGFRELKNKLKTPRAQLPEASEG